MRLNLGFRVSLFCWERDRIGVNCGRSRGNCIWVYMSCSWSARIERESSCQSFCEAAMSSSTVQQVQLPCERSDSMQGSPCGFAMVGSQIGEGNWASILSEFTCLVDVNLAALSWLLSCCGLNVGRSSFTFFALV